MTLYHFTAEHLARKIKRDGITKGAISLFDSRRRFVGIERGWIWLTDDPCWNQKWCADRILIPYDRSAVRFTVNIPIESENYLERAEGVLRSRFPNSAWLLDCPGSEHWWLYRGKVFRMWLTCMESRWRVMESIMEAEAVRG